MPNPYVNKVVQRNGSTLIDISDTTAVAADVASGKYFYLATGEKVVGTGSGGGGSGYTLTTVAAQQTVTPTSNGTYYGATLTVSTGLEAGADYIITINGTEYYYTCQLLWGTNYLLGDANYFYGSTGLPYPFGIIWMSGTTCTLAAGDGTTLTIKIEKIELVDEPITPPVLVTKSITQNGTYNASSDSADGYSSVTVNVAGSSWAKVAETTYTTSTTSTSAATVAIWETGHSEIWTNSKWVYVRIRDTAGKRAGYFYGSDQFFLNDMSSVSTSASGRFCIRYDSSGTFHVASQAGTSGYGVYADTVSSDGYSIRIRKRYNSTTSLTVNGTYKVEVYLLDPAGGVLPFA